MCDAGGVKTPVELGDDQLGRILAEHETWLKSRGKKGQPADLSGVRVYGAALRGRVLTRSVLAHADLTAADLSGTDLREANLACAILREATLRDTKLRGAILAGADLSTAKDLRADQLGCASLSGASLPTGILDREKLAERLQVIAEASKSAQRILLTLLLACVYSALTVATTRDPQLITNTARSPLPIIGTQIPIVGFYFAAPLLLLCIYLYLHLYLQRLWEALAQMPAVFPDGQALDARVYPWFLFTLLQDYSPHLNRRRPVFSRFQVVVSILLAWCSVPLSLYILWARYVPRHDWWGTTFHVVLLSVSILGGMMFHGVAKATLGAKVEPPFMWSEQRDEVLPWRRVSLWFFVSVAVLLLSTGAMVVPQIMRHVQFFGYRPHANLAWDTLSSQPNDWRSDSNMARVIGAQLSGKNLRGALAARAFLVNADLSSSDLRWASLFGADLRGASLSLANLDNATLELADLRNASLNFASLEGTNLRMADLRAARLAAIQGWERAVSLFRANLYGVVDPPDEFLEHATGQSARAVCIEADSTWQLLLSLSGTTADTIEWGPPARVDLKEFCGVVRTRGRQRLLSYPRPSWTHVAPLTWVQESEKRMQIRRPARLSRIPLVAERGR